MKFYLALGLLVVSMVADAFTLVKEFSEADLQAEVQRMMPFEQKTMFATIIVSQPLITLSEGEDSVGVRAHIQTISPNGAKGSGVVGVRGRVIYERSEGAFYIQQPELQTLDINGVDPVLSELIKPYVQALISGALSTTPVFVLDDNDAQQKLAKSSLQSVEVKDGKLQIKLKAFQ